MSYLGTFLQRDFDEQSVPYLHTLALRDYPEEIVARGKFRDGFKLNKDGELLVHRTKAFVLPTKFDRQ